MAGPIDNTLDELDNQLTELKREVARLEAFRRQLDANEELTPAASDTARGRPPPSPRSVP
jgi:hypothetical protein